jgi:hypothetical protein
MNDLEILILASVLVPLLLVLLRYYLEIINN